MISSAKGRDWSRDGAMDNRGALLVPFIGPWDGERWAVKGRKTSVVELQWHRLWEMKMGKGGNRVLLFSEGKRGGGEAALWCCRWMTQQRVLWWSGRPKVTAGVWMSIG
jgi:hypothetical protein